MRVGCPKEIKSEECRVGLVPATAAVLVQNGHNVFIEKDAGVGIGISNDAYAQTGAHIVSTADEVWAKSDMIVKVKEPLEPEFRHLREGLLLFTYLHLAAEPTLTSELLSRGTNSVAYETIEVGGALPLLKPMSEVAGRMSVQVGAWCLERHQGGRGVLLGGVPGVERGQVVVIGGGTVGTQAARMAMGMGADVTLLDTNLTRLNYLDDLWEGRVQTLFSDAHRISRAIAQADLIIGAVLVMGAKAPCLVPRNMLADMREGSVIVDVAIDQGGCVETIKKTSHLDPTYVVDGVIHYGVANMPGAVPRTSTFALTNVTAPYVLAMANLGLDDACLAYPELVGGINTYAGNLTCEPVAKSLGLAYRPYSRSATV